ncbi:uncharacterized protein LOC121826623 isoform X1 [Peromyscus maniculatus bairdii]|uniref:uncharacterized protein LOC121826623 isoform X1 n=1 Tax=Peromyscus maniculatus bairdii TaxID=230844 RepID=UPI003FD08DFF
MQEDTDPDALSIQAPKRARWYTCLWPSCLGHGCCCRKRRSKFPLVNGQDTRSRLSEKPDGPASTPGKEDTTYVVTKSKKQLFYFTNICTLKKMKTEINLSSLEKFQKVLGQDVGSVNHQPPRGGLHSLALGSGHRTAPLLAPPGGIPFSKPPDSPCSLRALPPRPSARDSGHFLRLRDRPPAPSLPPTSLLDQR